MKNSHGIANSEGLRAPANSFFVTLLAGLTMAIILPSPAPCGKSANDIYLDFLFVDTEGKEGVYDSELLMPGSVLEVEFPDGQKKTVTGGIPGLYWVSTTYPQRTPYIFHVSMPGFDGPAMGYNFVGFFSPAGYTLPVPASAYSTFRHRRVAQPDNWYGASTYLLIADRTDRPSIVLTEDYSAQWLDERPIHAAVNYLIGSDFYPRVDMANFKPGDVTFAAITLLWGAFPEQLTSTQAMLDSRIPSPPAQFLVSSDGYSTATLQITPQPHIQEIFTTLLSPEPNFSGATELVQIIGFEVPSPPLWVKERAITEKLSGKAKWLYPPLDRYADVNSDEVIDAADLVAVRESKR
ncbi:hypothetical protein BH09SUM1_BH09SUM1_17280 [soil metagenome]